MAEKNLFQLLFFFVMLLPYVTSKAILSEEERRELGCNAFSGWQTCRGKRVSILSFQLMLSSNPSNLLSRPDVFEMVN